MCRPASISELLDDLNAVLLEIERPKMFATAACFRLPVKGDATYALAGHHAILAAARAHGTQRDDQTVLLVRIGR